MPITSTASGFASAELAVPAVVELRGNSAFVQALRNRSPGCHRAAQMRESECRPHTGRRDFSRWAHAVLFVVVP